MFTKMSHIFTRQFVKDLIISTLFIFCVYAVTHNKFTYPQPEPVVGKWNIEQVQHPLFLGFAGHNYLVLRDGLGDVESELHGLATDPISGTWKYIGYTPTDELRVWEFRDLRYGLTSHGFPGTTIISGSAEEMRALWTKAKECGEAINAKHISYPRFGVDLRGSTENSNSVTYTLLRCMELPQKHIGLITPGSRTNLLEEN